METMGLQPSELTNMTWSHRQRMYDEKYKLEKQRAKRPGGGGNPRGSLGRRR